MGLDIVELVLRCEEVFGTELPDADLNDVLTVGDLYQQICKALQIEPGLSPTSELGVDHSPRGMLGLTLPHVWNAEDAWKTLVAVFVDQLCLPAEEILYTARIGPDLGCD